jgi:hypothetical protein
VVRQQRLAHQQQLVRQRLLVWGQQQALQELLALEQQELLALEQQELLALERAVSALG